MSTNSNNPVFISSTDTNLTGWNTSQVDIASGPGYVGRDWVKNQNSWNTNLSNRTTSPSNQDETKQITFTTDVNTLNIPYTVGDYTTPDGGVMPASTQRINFAGLFKSQTQGMVNFGNWFTVGSGLSYHIWNGATTNYVEHNSNFRITESVNLTYNPTTGDDEFADISLSVRIVDQESTSNNSFEANASITPILDGVVSSYYIGNLFIIDGVDSDSVTFDNTDSTMTATAGVIRGNGNSYSLNSDFDHTSAANNTVGFPSRFDSIESDYFESDYIETVEYVANDYAETGYFTVTQYIEPQITVGFDNILMLQDLAVDFDAGFQGGILWGAYSDQSSDFDTTTLGGRIQQLAAINSSDFDSVFSAGRIRGSTVFANSESSTLFNAGRIFQPELFLQAADFTQTATAFNEIGGDGVVGASSNITGQPGYLLSAAALNINADGVFEVIQNLGSSAGLLLSTANSELDSDFDIAGFAGLAVFGNSAMSTLTNTSTSAGYLHYIGTGQDLECEFDIPFIQTALIYVTQSYMSSLFDMPNNLAGFALYGATDLAGMTFQLGEGKLWISDPYRRLTVKPENTGLIVLLETNQLNTPKDSNNISVLTETNNIIVPQETKVFHIDLAPVALTRPSYAERV